MRRPIPLLPLTSLLSLVVGVVVETRLEVAGQVVIALAQEPLAAVLLLNLN
jgi:hypothetical protein